MPSDLAGAVSKRVDTGLVEAAPIEMAVIDADGTLLGVSVRFARAVAHPADILVGRSLAGLVDLSAGAALEAWLSDDHPDEGHFSVDLERGDGVPARAELIVGNSVAGNRAVLLRPPNATSRFETTDTGGDRHPPHQMASLIQWQLGVHELISGDSTPEQIFDYISLMVRNHVGGDCAITLCDLEDGRWNTTVIAAAGIEAALGVRAPLDSVGSEWRGTDIHVTHDLRDLPLYQAFHAANPTGHQPASDGALTMWIVAVTDHDTHRPLGHLAVVVENAREPTSWDREVLGAARRLAFLAAQRRRADLAHHQQQLFDPMTGMPRRELFLDRVGQAFRLGHPTEWAVVFVHLSELHLVNTSYGVEAGNQLIIDTANRLERLVGRNATCSRFGGDEFAVLVRKEEAEALSRTINDEFQGGLPPGVPRSGDITRVLTGVAFGDPTDDAESLCRKAQAALRWAHEPGTDTVVVWDEERRAGSVERLSLRGDLRRSVGRGELHIDYQPKVDLVTGRIAGAEALVRWHHPKHGVLRPDQFIALAEESGMIVDIGEWVLAEAVRTAAGWRDAGVISEDFLLAVNMSALQLWSPMYGEQVRTVLETHDWLPGSLSIELTETLLVSNYQDLLKALMGLKSLGVLLAADDFGTGYSALSYLDQLPLDILKVDKGFVARLDRDGRGSVVASAVVSMSEELGLRTCGEGVETPEQLAGLRALKCDWAQGYLMARPLEPDSFRELARSRPRW